ncbi:hypothetical protein D3C85_842420 [compost metagenome]
MNILGRGKQRAHVYAPSRNLKPDKITKLERYLDANRTNLLFAKGVILVEGDAEHILIPEIIKKVFGVSLDELGISIINIGSTGFENVAQLFHKDRIHRNCSILTDNDLSIVTLPKDPKDDNQYERDCRNSQISGVERKEKLELFCKDNDFVKPFYAKHTFEVDFLLGGNSHEISQTVEKEYKKQPDKDRIKGLLENKDVSISGKEVLRLAEKFGKGWFAIMVSEKISNITAIPKYILDAIVFACPTLNQSILLTIAKYRLIKLKDYHYIGDITDYESILDEIMLIEDGAEALEFFIENLPKDVLSKLISKLNA